MDRLRKKAIVIAAGVCLGAVQASEAPVAYPSGYRTWAHVKSTLIGAQAPGFAVNGGLHHYYANEKALEGYGTGKFPDGSVLIDDLLEVKDNAGVTSEGARRRVAVMVKAGGPRDATGGWDFEIFRGDAHEATLSPEAKAACYACHKNASDDAVFSKLRP